MSDRVSIGEAAAEAFVRRSGCFWCAVENRRATGGRVTGSELITSAH
jgi:hypothetical protein